MRQMLLQSATDILSENTSKVYYIMRQVFYYRMRQVYCKMWQFFQNVTILLENATVITKSVGTMWTVEKTLTDRRKIFLLLVNSSFFRKTFVCFF